MCDTANHVSLQCFGLNENNLCKLSYLLHTVFVLLGPHVFHKQLGGLEGLPADRAGRSSQAAKLLRNNTPGFKTSVCICVELGFYSTQTTESSQYGGASA